MKKTQFFTLLFMVCLFTGLTACKKKNNDADIKASIEKSFQADPEPGGAALFVDVKDGVVTITGDCRDDATRMRYSTIAKNTKGVNSVINNCTVAPVTTPVVNADDEALNRGLADALKDNPGVTYSLRDGKIVLSGEISKAKWAQLKETLDKLKSKGYDLTGLTIK